MYNYLKNNQKILSLVAYLTVFNFSFFMPVAQAQSATKSNQSSQIKTRAKNTINQPSDSNLFLADVSNQQIQSAKIEQQVIPLSNQNLIASSFSGQASWYGPGFHGRLTANGERYNQNALTAAHPSLRFGTRVRVTNLNNGRSVVVRINDRGPYAKGRVIDVSAAAANSLGMIQSGVAPVSVTILGQ